jgi:hypothetical protein
MEIIRKIYKPTAIFLSFYMLMLACPYQSVLAAMIDTESIIDLDRDQEARDQLKQFLAREDVQTVLIAHGIDPVEAKRRINALSDEEVIRIANQIDQLPAGGGAVETLLALILVLFLVLVILDLTGVTDVFPFIKSQKQK